MKLSIPEPLDCTYCGVSRYEAFSCSEVGVLQIRFRIAFVHSSIPLEVFCYSRKSLSGNNISSPTLATRYDVN